MYKGLDRCVALVSWEIRCALVSLQSQLCNVLRSKEMTAQGTLVAFMVDFNFDIWLISFRPREPTLQECVQALSWHRDTCGLCSNTPKPRTVSRLCLGRIMGSIKNGIAVPRDDSAGKVLTAKPANLNLHLGS